MRDPITTKPRARVRAYSDDSIRKARVSDAANKIEQDEKRHTQRRNPNKHRFGSSKRSFFNVPDAQENLVSLPSQNVGSLV